MILLQNERHDCDDHRGRVAQLVLDRFNEPQFVADALRKARRPDGEMVPDALTFLMELGESVATELLEELDSLGTSNGHAFYDELLRNLGAVTAKEALARIRDPRPEYVQHMIRIIRRAGDAHTAEKLKSLLEHESVDVRLEALATLLKFNNNWGLVWLREKLGQLWSDEVRRVVGLAAEYRVLDVVPELVSYLERPGEMDRREAALLALCQMGDASTIAPLIKFAQRRWSLAQKQNQHLKRVLFENLGAFYFEDIKPLLHLGLKHKDPAIRSASEKWYRLAPRRNPSGQTKEKTG